jgi:hypothetical protein
VIVQCDSKTHEWVVHLADSTYVKRLPIDGLDVTTLTGITDMPLADLPPVQLTLPLAA